MSLAKKFAVPKDISLLYEFLNSADLRTYVEKGDQHVPSDECGTPAQLEVWMRNRSLLTAAEAVEAPAHRSALDLRSAMRSFLEIAPNSRATTQEIAQRLNKVMERYPLVVQITPDGTPALVSSTGVNGLAKVVAELFRLAERGQLDRLKMCNSEECQWIFFDRSRPGKRRWCSSLLCGNRHKTRAYRGRQKVKKAKRGHS